MMGMERDWWRNSEVAQAINLTDQQTQELNQIFSAHKPTLIQLKGNVESEETKFHDLLDQAQPQQDQVLAELTQLQAAHNALEKEFTVMSLAFRSVLSPDQWSKLQTFRRDKMMRFGHRAEPGAPGNSEPSQPQ
jgi:Spy/CpxP family protein refolding chaperone